MTFGDAIFTLKVTALPEYISNRRTTNPQFLLGTSLFIVVVILTLITATLLYFRRREAQHLQAEADRRQQEVQVINAAKEAHEKTIAYACHQLR